MIKKIYYKIRDSFLSKPDEVGERSAGHWQDLIRQAVLSKVANVASLLELGCGEGLFLSALRETNAEMNITGLDISEAMIARASERFADKGIKNIDLVLGSGEKLSFGDSSFDAVVCMNVIYNLPSETVLENLLHEAIRVCKVRGRIVFDIRNSSNLLINLKYMLAPYYDETVKDLPLRTYRIKYIREVVSKLGAEIVSVKQIGFPWNFFAPILIIEAEKK